MKKRIMLARRKRWFAGLLTVPILTLMGIASTGCSSAISEDAPPGMVLWAAVTTPKVPASAELLRRGKLVYNVRCATCHGLAGDGKGPASIFLKTPPRDFTQLKFKLRTTQNFPSDLDLFRSVTAGFPIYGMPRFDYLAEEDRWALVYYVKELAKDGWTERFRNRAGEGFDPKEAMEIASDLMDQGDPVVLGGEPASDAASLARGKALYTESCLKCHGESGRGDGPSAPTLEDNWGRPIEPRDFGEARVFRKGGWRLVDTVRLVRLGVAGTPMPSHPDLEGSEAWDLARYVHELRNEALRTTEE